MAEWWTSWWQERERALARFLASLHRGGGRFLPCRRGATPAGRRLGLGLSCLALKTYYTLGLWDDLSPEDRRDWLEFICSYQVERPRPGAFLDRELERALRHPPLGERLRRRLGRSAPPPPLEVTVAAETKQAIATLAQVGARPPRPFRDFPRTPGEVRSWLEAQPWERPWAAGGRSAALAVFTVTQGPRLLGSGEVSRLVAEQAAFYRELARPQSGAYFRGPAPEGGELINGAMKVLTALDWLELPIPYPEALLDTCLQAPPASEGCHLVDWVYVLYRCLQQTDHRREQARQGCLRVLEMIREHARPDGGFSYYRGRSQTNYYGVVTARGLDESDLHATCLLTWALAMIGRILGQGPGWRVIKP